MKNQLARLLVLVGLVALVVGFAGSGAAWGQVVEVPVEGVKDVFESTFGPATIKEVGAVPDEGVLPPADQVNAAFQLLVDFLNQHGIKCEEVPDPRDKTGKATKKVIVFDDPPTPAELRALAAEMAKVYPHGG